MLFQDRLVLVRGGGDLATGAIYRLHRAGFPVVVTELETPLTIRRSVALSTAVTEGTFVFEGMSAVRVDSSGQAVELAGSGQIPVLVSPSLPETPQPVAVVVDARLAKRNIDTTIDDAPFVVGLGPGFTAGSDCHAVVETMRGHHLGRVFTEGTAAPDTGIPGVVGGESGNRVLRALSAGPLRWSVSIGDAVQAGDVLGDIDGVPVKTQIGGVVRGLLAAGVVAPGLKIADVDPRADRSACFEISDKSLAVGGGVLEAVLMWLGRSS